MLSKLTGIDLPTAGCSSISAGEENHIVEGLTISVRLSITSNFRFLDRNTSISLNDNWKSSVRITSLAMTNAIPWHQQTYRILVSVQKSNYLNKLYRSNQKRLTLILTREQ